MAFPTRSAPGDASYENHQNPVRRSGLQAATAFPASSAPGDASYENHQNSVRRSGLQAATAFPPKSAPGDAACEMRVLTASGRVFQPNSRLTRKTLGFRLSRVNTRANWVRLRSPTRKYSSAVSLVDSRCSTRSMLAWA